MDNVDVFLFVYMYGLIAVTGGLAVLFVYLYERFEK